jgi:hypothetical protein
MRVSWLASTVPWGSTALSSQCGHWDRRQRCLHTPTIQPIGALLIPAGKASGGAASPERRRRDPPVLSRDQLLAPSYLFPRSTALMNRGCKGRFCRLKLAPRRDLFVIASRRTPTVRSLRCRTVQTLPFNAVALVLWRYVGTLRVLLVLCVVGPPADAAKPAFGYNETSTVVLYTIVIETL